MTTHDDPRLRYFRALTHSAQLEAVRRLAALGYRPIDIAVATGWSVEAVARALEFEEVRT